MSKGPRIILPPISRKKLATMTLDEVENFFHFNRFDDAGEGWGSYDKLQDAARIKLLDNFVKAKSANLKIDELQKAIESCHPGRASWEIRPDTFDQTVYQWASAWIAQKDKISPGEAKLVSSFVQDEFCAQDLLSRCFEKDGYSTTNLESFLANVVGGKIKFPSFAQNHYNGYRAILNRNHSSLEFIDRWFDNLPEIDFQFFEEKFLPLVGHDDVARVWATSCFVRSRGSAISFDELRRNTFDMLSVDNAFEDAHIKRTIVGSWLQGGGVSEDELTQACEFLEVEKDSFEEFMRAPVTIAPRDDVKEFRDLKSLISDARNARDGIASAVVEWIDFHAADFGEDSFEQALSYAENDSERLDIIRAWPFSHCNSDQVEHLVSLVSDEAAKADLLAHFIILNQGDCSYEQVKTLRDNRVVGQWAENVGYKFSYEELVGLKDNLDQYDFRRWFTQNKLEGNIAEAEACVAPFYNEKNKPDLLLALLKNRSPMRAEEIKFLLDKVDGKDAKKYILECGDVAQELGLEGFIDLCKRVEMEALSLKLATNLMRSNTGFLTVEEFDQHILPLLSKEDEWPQEKAKIARQWLSRCSDQDEETKLKYLKLFAVKKALGPYEVGKYYSRLGLSKDKLIESLNDFYANDESRVQMFLSAIAVSSAEARGANKKLAKKLINSGDGQERLGKISELRSLLDEGDVFDIVSQAGVDFGSDYKKLSEALQNKTLADVLTAENCKAFNESLEAERLIPGNTSLALTVFSLKISGSESLKKLTDLLGQETRLEVGYAFISDSEAFINNMELPACIAPADMVSVEKLATAIRPKIKPVPPFDLRKFPKELSHIRDFFAKNVGGISEDEVAKFFEAILNLETEISREAKDEYGSERSKLHRVFQAKRDQCAYILQRDDGVARISKALFALKDGCVANFATAINKAVNNLLIDDEDVRMLHAFFEEFSTKMLNSLPTDALGGSREGLDSLNNRFNDRFSILPSEFLEKFSASYTSEAGTTMLEKMKGGECYEELQKYIGDQDEPDYSLPNKIVALLIVKKYCPEIVNHPLAKNFVDGCKEAFEIVDQYETLDLSDVRKSAEEPVPESRCLPKSWWRALVPTLQWGHPKIHP